MRLKTFLFVPAAFLAAAVLSGCGKSESDAARYNEVLGGTIAGAPVGQPANDRGILADQTAYKPATPPGGSAAPDGGSAKGGAGGGEADAVKAFTKAAFESLTALNADVLFDPFIATQVKAITTDEIMSEIRNVFGAIDNLSKVMIDKAGPEGAKIKEMFATGASTAISGLLADAKVDLLSESTGTVQLNVANLMKSALAISPEAMENAKKAAGGVDPSAALSAMPPVALQVKKIDGKWKLDLGHDLGEAEANDVLTGLNEMKAAIQQMTETVDGMKEPNPQAMQAAMFAPGMQLGLALNKILTAVIGGAHVGGPVAAPDAPKAEEKKPEGEKQPDAPVEPAGAGRRGRGRP